MCNQIIMKKVNESLDFNNVKNNEGNALIRYTKKQQEELGQYYFDNWYRGAGINLLDMTDEQKKPILFILEHPDLVKYKVKDNSELREILSKNYQYLMKNIKQYNWLDLSNLKTLRSLWYDTDEFTGDISEWNTGHIADMEFTFFRCPIHFNIKNWDVSGCMNFHGIFLESCFTTDDIKNWNINPEADTRDMFNYGETYNPVTKSIEPNKFDV